MSGDPVAQRRNWQRSQRQEAAPVVRLDRRNPSYDATLGTDQLRRRDDQVRRNGQRDDRARDGRWDNRDDRRNDRGWDNRNGANNRNWNRDWRHDGRYDWNRYRSSNRRLFSLPRYYAPYGWDYGYRRFSIGAYLSDVLWGQNYWIDDPWEYRLPEAYGPYRWVRYYNDALLVDLRTGYVVDTVYGIFY